MLEGYGYITSIDLMRLILMIYFRCNVVIRSPSRLELLMMDNRIFSRMWIHHGKLVCNPKLIMSRRSLICVSCNISLEYETVYAHLKIYSLHVSPVIFATHTRNVINVCKAWNHAWIINFVGSRSRKRNNDGKGVVINISGLTNYMVSYTTPYWMTKVRELWITQNKMYQR